MLLNDLNKIRNFKVLCHLLAIVILTDKAAALFDGCDYKTQINPGYFNFQSQNYPNSYPAGSSCRYEFIAPLDYEITLNCTINLAKNSNTCSTEAFYVARDGDPYLRDSEELCGAGTFVRKSLFRSLVVAHVSQGSWGNYKCQLYVTPQQCDCGWSVSTKIANGQETGKNEYPSMVALKVKNTAQSFCGGCIVSHRHILTAAHCMDVQKTAGSIEAWAGDHDLSSGSRYAVVHQISQIIKHPSYTSNPVNNDLAILVTSAIIEWTRGVGPACLPPNNNDAFTYSYTDVIGWGTTKFAGPTSAVLQKVTLMVIDQQTCANAYQGVPIYPTQICTYDYTGKGSDSCQFDSGGPVILRKTREFLVGCISFGKNCGQAYATGVNTRISSYLDWIKQNTGYSTCNVSM